MRFTGIPSHLAPFTLGLAFLSAAAIASGGCNTLPTAPSSYAPYSQTDLRTGTGDTAGTGSIVSVNYTGWLYNGDAADQKGASFDSSLGQTPFFFAIGSGSVISGWEQGIPGMRVGGIRRLVIPPSLAYGGARADVLPPHSTLVFEIELLSVQ